VFLELGCMMLMLVARESEEGIERELLLSGPAQHFRRLKANFELGPFIL
jgi:hypothetical protein